MNIRKNDSLRNQECSFYFYCITFGVRFQCRIVISYTLRPTRNLVDLRVEFAAYGYTDAVSSVMCRVRPTHSCTLAPCSAVFATDRLRQ